MSSPTPLRNRSLELAAQADLVLLTVEMLRSPQAIQKANQPPWFEQPREVLRELIQTAFHDSQTAFNDSLPRNETQCENVHNDASPPPSLFDSLQEVYELVQQLDRETWSDEFWRLFDSSQACAVNQASYIRRDKGTILGDLCGFYNAFGWQGNRASGERPDHLLCQLEFTGMLLAMAAQTNDQQQRELVEQALAQFARLHMHDWLPSVTYQLIESTALPYYGAVAQWLMLLWSRLTEFNNWPIDTAVAQMLSPNVDPEDPYECGAPDLVQLGKH